MFGVRWGVVVEVLTSPALRAVQLEEIRLGVNTVQVDVRIKPDSVDLTFSAALEIKLQNRVRCHRVNEVDCLPVIPVQFNPVTTRKYRDSSREILASYRITANRHIIKIDRRQSDRPAVRGIVGQSISGLVLNPGTCCHQRQHIPTLGGCHGRQIDCVSCTTATGSQSVQADGRTTMRQREVGDVHTGDSFAEVDRDQARMRVARVRGHIDDVRCWRFHVVWPHVDLDRVRV